MNALDVSCAQLTRDLFAIAKFLFCINMHLLVYSIEISQPGIELFLPRDDMHKLSLCRSAMSVCPSVTFVYSIEMNKRIFNIFHNRVATQS